MSRRRTRRISREPVRIEVTSTGHDGRGIAHLNGKATFIDGALAGEDVSFVYDFKRKQFDEGHVVEIHRPSPSRVTPPCAHAAVCGGCSLQHMAPSEQVSMKEGLLLEQLSHFGGLVPARVRPPVLGPTLGYRRKARLSVKYVPKKGGVLVGFREKRSAYVAEIDSCVVLDGALGEQINALRSVLDTLTIKSRLPQIEVAGGDDTMSLIVRHLDPMLEGDQAALVDFCKAQGFSLYLQPGGEQTVHKVWPDDGRDRMSYAVTAQGLMMHFHPADFVQVNADINQKMIAQALELLAPTGDDYVLDLFCGLGNFTLPLATRAKQVIGVEGSRAMVERGYENARANDLGNVDFFAADLTASLDQQPWAKEPFTKVLIDPPRSGAKALMPLLGEISASRVVYVSCNPATLARDAGELSTYGYRLAEVGILDMFPHTAHVESIALFEKCSKP